MIEINLLPGARKSKRAGPALDVGAAFAGVVAQVKDPFLIIAVAGLVIGLAGVGLQYVLISRRESSTTERLQVAVRDSVRYSAVRAQLDLAEAQRDSVVRQLSIIRAIDSERYTWPHVLDELSQALPQYTWLTQVQQTSAVPSVVVSDSVKGPRARRMELIADAAMAAVTRLQLRVVGQTVDVQAITRYGRLLEASPFIENVTLVGTNVTQSEQREVIQFTFDMRFQQPDPSAIKTVPLTVAVR